MQIVIDIPDEIYKKYMNDRTHVTDVLHYFRHGTPLPEHHGDLIDRNELLDESYQIDSMYCMYDEVVKVDDIKNAPTIIEGSDSE